VSDAWQIRTEGQDCAYQVWDLVARNSFRGAFHGPDPAQARPAQILKRNQEEARADRARLLAAAENGRKISIMLEECALPYNVIPVNLSKGEQFKPEFLSISSDNRMPVMVGPTGRAAVRSQSSVGCNPAISGTQHGSFYPRDERGRVVVDQGDRTSTSSHASSGGLSACWPVPPVDRAIHIRIEEA
jgi:hypothetical protein